MEIIAEKREKLGKKAKTLYKDKKIPGVVFGKGADSVPLSVNINNLKKVYEQAGETSLIDLKIGDASEKVLIKNIDIHPVTSAPVHVNFLRVNLKEKLTAQIPVEVIGEENSPILKSGEGILLTLINEIEVEALPTDLPHEFIVDVSNLTEIGQSITVDQLSYDKSKVEIQGHEAEEAVVKVDHAVMAEEEEPAVTEEELVEGVDATAESKEEAETEGEDTESKE